MESIQFLNAEDAKVLQRTQKKESEFEFSAPCADPLRPVRSNSF